MFKLDLFNKKKLKKIKDNFTKLNSEFIRVNGEKEYYSNMNCKLENEMKELKIQIDNLEKISNLTIQENQKLINWIMNILDTVGTMEAREKTEFKIPICRHKEYRAYDRNYMGIFEKERITIPEITIIKMG